jgi:CelD/BcsL family acetyltransferase involved in cellulose biosynthesis
MPHLQPYDIDILSPNPVGITVRALRSLDEIDAIEDRWEELLARSECNRAFSSFAWYRSACACYSGIEPFLLVAERAGDPIAILPLVADSHARALRFATRLGDYNDIIAPAVERDACAHLLEHAREALPHDWMLPLNFLRDDSNCIAALRRMCDAREVESWFEGKRICPFIDLNKLGGDYLRARSRASRMDLLRCRRGAERAGANAVVLDPAVITPGTLPDFFLALHRERFGDASPLVSGEDRAFVEMALPLLFAKGKTLAIALVVDDAIIAIDLLHLGARSLCSWNGGFSASAAHLSPGTLVIDAGIREAVARGCDEYDMLRGTEAYKLSICDSRRSLANSHLRGNDRSQSNMIGAGEKWQIEH